jgi:hypothetical protein
MVTDQGVPLIKMRRAVVKLREELTYVEPMTVLCSRTCA